MASGLWWILELFALLSWYSIQTAATPHHMEAEAHQFTIQEAV